MDPLDQQLNQRLVQSLEPGNVRLYRGPRREEVLHPAFSLKPPQNLERVFFVADLLEPATCQIRGNGFDRLRFLGVLITNLRSLLELPSRTCLKTHGTK